MKYHALFVNFERQNNLKMLSAANYRCMALYELKLKTNG